MSIAFEFLFDFGSPNAYLAHRAMPALVRRTGVSARYVPVLLGGIFKATNNQSPGTAYAGIRNKLEYEAIEMTRFIERHGILNYRRNAHFPVNTLAIMRGAVAAQNLGLGEAYNEAVFCAMWERSMKMDDPAVIEACLRDAGLADRGILQSMSDQAIKDELLRNTEAAVARGAFGAPTFFVNDEIYFGKDRLRDAEERIVALQA